jgi:hypothetical protein
VIATGVRQATAQDGEMEFSRPICICVYFCRSEFYCQRIM